VDDQLLADLPEKALIDIIYNFKKYGYKEGYKELALEELKGRDISEELLEKLESNIMVQNEDERNSIIEEFYFLKRLKFSLTLYYSVKVSLISVLSLFSFLIFRYGNRDENSIKIIVVFNLFLFLYLFIEKPLRIFIIRCFENLKQDLVFSSESDFWIREELYIIFAVIIPFLDFYYLKKYFEFKSKLILYKNNAE